MTSEELIAAAAERISRVTEGDPLFSERQYRIKEVYAGYPQPNTKYAEDHFLLARHYLTTLAAREEEQLLIKEVAAWCNDAIKHSGCTSTERIQFEESRDDLLVRLAKALQIESEAQHGE